MAGKRDIKTTLKLEGEQQFKKGMSDAASAIKVLNSEQKLAQAQFTATGDAENYAAERTRILKEKIEQQKLAVSNAEAAVKAMKEQGIDPNSKAMQTWRTKLNNAKTALTNMQTELNATEGELGEQGQAFNNATTEAGEYREQLDQIGKNVDFSATIQAIENVRARLKTIITTALKAGKSMWSLERGAAGWADELAANAQIAELDVVEYQGWLYASEMIDSSVDTIRKAYKKLNKSLAKPTDETLKMLNELGVANLDPMTGHARDTMDVFWEIVDAMGQMENANDRDAMAMELFGKSFDELIPLIEAGSEAYKKWIEIGKERAVSPEAINNLTSFDDTLNDLKARFDQTKYTILADLAPAFETAASAIADALAAFNSFVASDEGQKKLKKLRDAISGFGDGIKKANFKKIVGDVSGVIQKLVDVFAWFVDHSVIVAAALGTIGAAFVGLTVSKDVLSVLQLIRGINWGQVKSVAGSGAVNAGGAASNAAANAAGAKTAAAIGQKMSAGAILAGTALTAAVGYVMKKGADYRAEYGPIGSVEAIEKAMQGNKELQAAMAEWIDANRDYQAMWDSGNLFGEEAEKAAERMDAANKAFFDMEGSEILKDLYNDYRQINGLGDMEWPMPDIDGLLNATDETVNAAQAAADAMPSIGENIAIGLGDGIYAASSYPIEAARWLGDAVAGGLRMRMAIQSPSKVMRELGEYVSEGFALGIEDNVGMVQRATSRMVAATTRGISGPGAPSAAAGVAGGADGGMVHITLMMDGKEFADVITPYVDSSMGMTLSRRR